MPVKIILHPKYLIVFCSLIVLDKIDKLVKRWIYDVAISRVSKLYGGC